MKKLIPLMIAFMSLNSFAKPLHSTDVNWSVDVNPEETGIYSKVVNNSTKPQSCSLSINISLEDDYGFVKSVKNINYRNFYIGPLESLDLPILMEDLTLDTEELRVSRFAFTTAKSCNDAGTSRTEIVRGIKNALENNHIDYARVLSDRYNIKNENILDLSSSYFNRDLSSLASFHFNHVEIANTLYDKRTRGPHTACLNEKSIACGYIYKNATSSSCGVKTYINAVHPACGVAQYKLASTSSCDFLRFKRGRQFL